MPSVYFYYFDLLLENCAIVKCAMNLALYFCSSDQLEHKISDIDHRKA